MAEFMAAVFGDVEGSIAEQETARLLHDQKGIDWKQVGISSAEFCVGAA